jgi:hypothetical protein
MRRSNRWGIVAAAIAVTAIGAAAVIGAGASGFGAQTVTPTCTLVVPGSPTTTYQRTLVLRADTPDTVPAGARLTVAIAAEAESLPMSSPHGQFVAGWSNVRTTYLVTGGTVDASSIQVTAFATINSTPLAADVTASGNVVDVNVAGPMPSGTFRSPGITFDVIADGGDASVDVRATGHAETTNFSGPGPATSGVATCPLDVALATTSIGGTLGTSVPSTSTSTTTITTTSTSTTSTTSTTVAEPTTTTTAPEPTTTTTITPPPTPTTATSTTTTTVPPSGPTISISNAGVAEPPKGSTDLVFTVSLSAPAPGKVVVHYVTVDDTATQKLDYVGNSGNVRIKRGDTIATIKVRVRSDSVADPNEFFWVQLSNPTGATLAKASGFGWIAGG